jgi:hypothetical protein
MVQYAHLLEISIDGHVRLQRKTDPPTRSALRRRPSQHEEAFQLKYEVDLITHAVSCVHQKCQVLNCAEVKAGTFNPLDFWKNTLEEGSAATIIATAAPGRDMRPRPQDGAAKLEETADGGCGASQRFKKKRSADGTMKKTMPAGALTPLRCINGISAAAPAGGHGPDIYVGPYKCGFSAGGVDNATPGRTPARGSLVDIMMSSRAPSLPMLEQRVPEIPSEDAIKREGAKLSNVLCQDARVRTADADADVAIAFVEGVAAAIAMKAAASAAP